MPSEATTRAINATEQKLKQILDPEHPLCREDVVWMLGYIKKKVKIHC